MSDTPPYPLQECLKGTGMYASGYTLLMKSHQFVITEDMLFSPLSEDQDLMKIYNRQQTRHTNKFGMDVQKKVLAFIYWLRELQRSQEPIIYTLWTQSQLVLSVQELEVEVSFAKAYRVKIKVGKIDVGWGWYDWKDSFFTKM